MSESASHAYALLAAERDHAERQLNGVRAIVLGMLAVAAICYAPALPARLNAVNALVLVPMLVWTAVQYVAIFRRYERSPSWLALVNPVADISAVTLAMGGYGLGAGPSLALKSPMVLAYLVILAGRPIASSVRNAAVAAALVVIGYASLDWLFLSRGAAIVPDPITASQGGAVSLLDEGMKLVLLAAAGGVAIYATWWHERLALQYFAEAREREVLQSRLAASQLDSLKQQLQPHFLFNALNAMSALVNTEPAVVQRMIGGLGELIRVSLDSGADQEVPLARELAVLDHYIAIQRVRFQDRLTVTIDASDDVRGALVPTLILQPLVENSIKYGLAQRAAPGRVDVRAWRDGAALAIVVADDGPGLQGRPVASIAERVGVGNARARLQYLYGDEHAFVLESPQDGGFIVSMRIPYHVAPVSPCAS